MKGKVMLITSEDVEADAELAGLLAREGMDIAVVNYNECDAHPIRRVVEQQGQKCMTISNARRTPLFAEWVVGEVLKKFGRLDGFIGLSEPDITSSILPDVHLMAATMNHLKTAKAI